MPRLTPRGDVLAGTGGVQGSLNGTPYPFPTYGGGSPLTADTMLLSIPAPAPLLAQLATWQPGQAAPTVIADGANDFAADGGRWVAWRAGAGVYGSLGTFPAAGTAGPHSVAPDGTIALIPNRQIGFGLTLVDPDGLVHDIPNIVPTSVQVLGAGRVLWQSGAYGTVRPSPAAADAQGVLVVTLDDGDWLVYWSDAIGFVAQRDDASDGYILGTSPTFFNHDARNVNGELNICWSLTQGEAPGDVRSVVIDRTQPRALLVPTVRPPSFGFTHPVLVCPFKAEGSGVPDLFTLGTYTEADALPSPMPSGRLLIAHDAQTDWLPPYGLRPYDLPMLEWYRDPSETIAQSAARWTRQTLAILAAWPGDVGGIPMFYTQNRWTVAEVYAALSYVSALVNLSPRLKVIAPFEYDRANGVTGVPELQPVFAALLAAGRVAGAATLTPITVTPPPDHHPPPSNPNPPIPVPPTETEMQLPARCYVLLHNSDIATVAPGKTAVELAHAPEEEGGWQEVEVTKSVDWTPTNPVVLVRFVAANRLFRVDKVLARDGKYDQCVETWDPAAPDADSDWQKGVAAGPFIHYLSDSVDGQRHLGVCYTLTCVDGNGQLFQ